MKIETSIQPRKNGNVIVTGVDGMPYTFRPDPETGMVVGFIDDEPTLAHLLRLGTFFPADEADHDRASELVGEFLEDHPTLAEEPSTGEVDEPDDDPVDPNALPLEAGTAPVRKKAKA